jgi:hypothetical protein
LFVRESRFKEVEVFIGMNLKSSSMKERINSKRSREVMLNNPYNSSAMVSSALPTLLSTVSQASFGPQQPSGGINQLAGLGGQQPMYPQPMSPQPMYPQAMMMPGYGMPPYGQAGFPPGGRVVTTVTQTVNKTYIPPMAPMSMPYPGMPMPPMPFGGRFY